MAKGYARKPRRKAQTAGLARGASALRGGGEKPTLAGMKRVWIIFLCLLGPALVNGAPQGADQADIDARFARVNSAVEQLLESNVALQKRIDHLEEELRAAREEQNRAATNTAVAEDLRNLAEALREVDHKREADKELILEQLGKIAKSMAEGGPGRTASIAARGATTNVSENVYEYIVKPGDYLDDILEFHNKQFKEQHRKRLTKKEVLEANPGLLPDRLRKGQKIIIPQPPLQ
jgi:cell division protein FtsB